MSNVIHCPICNTKKIMGMGLVIYQQSALVQYKCCDCSELFFLPDQRGQLPAQVSEQTVKQSETAAIAAASPPNFQSNDAATK